MVPLERSNALILVLDTPKGRGLFAKESIPASTVLDTAPVIVLSDSDFENYIQHSELLHYTYNWPVKEEGSKTKVLRQAVVLGLGSMFNHSTVYQNVGWKRDLKRGVIVYTALRDLLEGEELLISYGTKLTFVDVEAKELESEEEEDPFARLVVDSDEDA